MMPTFYPGAWTAGCHSGLVSLRHKTPRGSNLIYTQRKNDSVAAVNLPAVNDTVTHSGVGKRIEKKIRIRKYM